MFTAAKDKLTSMAARAHVSDLIKAYGRVEELTIDSKCRRIELVCTLEGEVAPIGVCVEKYELERREGKQFICVLECTATRPWLQAAMRVHLVGRRFELPPWMAAAL